MINLHLNGDIVRCPDTVAIKARIKERNEAEHRCKYGLHEYYCPRWQKYVKEQPEIKEFKKFGACIFAYNDSCPMHKKRVTLGLKAKTFDIDNVNYRKLSSAAHYLVKSSNHKTLFITLTFPKFKKKQNEKQLNEYFSRFSENLRKNYNSGGYVAIRERGKLNNRVHFHLLLSIPFIPFVTLNSIWCNTISDICEFAPNAVTSDPKTLFIRNPARALRYVCKYFAKGRGQKSKSRLIFMSNNLIKKPIYFSGSINQILDGYKGIYIQQTSDYSTSFRITNPIDFDRFCNEFLYELFDLPYKPIELYSFNSG